ncbi:hypothetical protein HPB47_004414 [Ixodes persulcatus]|uniref:Uncharacterized protein n=1 Tax=Ixodes persulcatus TaxID=34615 RepID=A0AC60PGR2_IXOPE|nr:hypothetical protein HPB47_004414 [Ixodes persulcatus]
MDIRAISSRCSDDTLARLTYAMPGGHSADAPSTLWIYGRYPAGTPTTRLTLDEHTMSGVHSADAASDTQLSPTALFDTSAPYTYHLPHHTLLLDAPITFAELQAAVQALKRNTTPGHDDITSTLLRHPNEKSDSFQMPDRGTPQGAVLSPMLFNLTLIPLAPTLLTSPTLRSTLYADDIALWVHSGSDQHIEATLQHGLNRALHQIEL